MRLELEGYLLADPVFFDTSSRWERGVAEFPVAARPTPAGWRRTERDVWTSLTPTGVELPRQGWKIHVSAGLDNAERVLTTAWEYCVDHQVPFKYLCSPAAHRANSFKYAPRSASGKLVTIYPIDEVSLRELVTELSELLAGEPSPYILSDLRYGDGPLYLRYGGFVSRYCVADDGELVYAVERPDGQLVPDRRQPVFSVPSWVEIPDFLQPHLAARTAGGAGDWPYQVESALHFSNGGGVYRARRRADDQVVILKEARPLAGLDKNGRDAVTRLHDEAAVLRKLHGIPGVPAVYEHFPLWEHHFLAMAEVPGDSLQTWLARAYPLTQQQPSPQRVEAYTARALRLLGRVEELVAAIHARGVVFGDLHPANIMVGPDDQVSLVDFEMASDLTEERTATAGYPGFVAWHKRGADRDHHALAVLRLWLFLPLTSMLALAPGKADSYLAEIEHRFPLPPEFGRPLREALRPSHADAPGSADPGGGAPGDAPGDAPGGDTRDDGARRESGGRCGPAPLDLAAEWDWPAVRDSIAGGILAAATLDRTDRLFPGDPQQFRHDSLGLAYGPAGVLWALSVAGAGRHPAHEQWLLAAADRTPPPRPGLLDGATGVAYVLSEFGYADAADQLLTAAAPLVPTLRDLTLFSGLAGVGLALLHFAEVHDRDEALAQARTIGVRLAAAVRSGDPYGIDVAKLSGGTRHRDAGSRGGLLRGWSGVAYFLIRCYQTSQRLDPQAADADLLTAATEALHRDLALCVPQADGSWQVDGGYRTLPYLEIGSAGVAMVGAELLTVADDDRIRAALPPLTAACTPEFVLEPQLANGRAGLLCAVDWLRRRATDPDHVRQLTDSLHRHRRLLSWHAVSYRSWTAFPGTGLWRLSTDVATGSAGVLLALAAAEQGTPVLPLVGTAALADRPTSLVRS